jgi:hypothetical protein
MTGAFVLLGVTWLIGIVSIGASKYVLESNPLRRWMTVGLGGFCLALILGGIGYYEARRGSHALALLLAPIAPVIIQAKPTSPSTDNCQLTHSTFNDVHAYDSGEPGVPAFDIGTVCDSTFNNITAEGPYQGLRIQKAVRDRFFNMNVRQTPPPPDSPAELLPSPGATKAPKMK